MRYKKINDVTVQCIISEDDMQEYGLTLSDILERNEKGEEFLRDIIERAHEEVGYDIGSGNIAMQITPLGDNGLSITFTENGPAVVRDMLQNIKELLQGIGAEVSSPEGGAQPNAEKRKEADPALDETKRLFVFSALHPAMRYAVSIPSGICVKSRLYKADQIYYLMIEKGRISQRNFNRISAQAIEFGSVCPVTEEQEKYLEEHGECLIAERAVSRLRRIYLHADGRSGKGKKGSDE